MRTNLRNSKPIRSKMLMQWLYRSSRVLLSPLGRLEFASLRSRLILKLAAMLLIALCGLALLIHWELQSLSMMILMLKPDPMVVDRMALTEQRLMGLSGIFAVGTIAIVAWIVLRSLKPLTDLSHWISSSQNYPYPMQRLPKDLKQSAEVWNETLAQFSMVKQQQRQFINDVAHELRSPLSLVYGYLQRALKRRQNLSETQQESLSMATAEAERMRLILQDLLDLARSKTIDAACFQEPLLLNEVVRDIVDMIAKFENHEINIEIVPTSIRVQSSRDYLMQVLNHLIRNAIQNSEINTAVVVRLITEQNNAVIQIVDRGSGIALSQQDSVFEPFFRVDPSRARATGGSGLGLAIVKSLVEQMGGSITLDSELGIGSQFSVTFPISGGKR